MLGLGFSVYQYFQALGTDSVSAVTVGTPDPGHAWSQMECSAGSLCVDTTNNRLGVGTNTPAQKLSVAGVVQSTTGGFMFPDGSTQTSAAGAGISGSGTAAYVPRWSSGSALTNSIIYDNGTNVGIGTTSLAQKLSVNGNITASGDICIGTAPCLSSLPTTPSGMLYCIGPTNIYAGPTTRNRIIFVCPAAGYYSYGFATNGSSVEIVQNSSLVELVTTGTPTYGFVANNGCYINPDYYPARMHRCAKGDVIHLNFPTALDGGVAGFSFSFLAD